MGILFILGAILIVLYIAAAALGIGNGLAHGWPTLALRGGGMILILVVWWITQQNRPFRYKK